MDGNFDHAPNEEMLTLKDAEVFGQEVAVHPQSGVRFIAFLVRPWVGGAGSEVHQPVMQFAAAGTTPVRLQQLKRCVVLLSSDRWLLPKAEKTSNHSAGM
jgi:hypothetical protein